MESGAFAGWRESRLEDGCGGACGSGCGECGRARGVPPSSKLPRASSSIRSPSGASLPGACTELGADGPRQRRLRSPECAAYRRQRSQRRCLRVGMGYGSSLEAEDVLVRGDAGKGAADNGLCTAHVHTFWHRHSSSSLSSSTPFSASPVHTSPGGGFRRMLQNLAHRVCARRGLPPRRPETTSCLRFALLWPLHRTPPITAVTTTAKRILRPMMRGVS
ncbi:hypothetical protein JB92DRAFT_3001769 [Gautieria morchelliformis]|nr:hypothetical protein JB92DRAFT_3001769 [Gautieria morchelliformis]